MLLLFVAQYFLVFQIANFSFEEFEIRQFSFICLFRFLFLKCIPIFIINGDFAAMQTGNLFFKLVGLSSFCFFPVLLKMEG